MLKSPRNLVFRHDLRTKAVHTHEEDDMMRNISTKNVIHRSFQNAGYTAL